MAGKEATRRSRHNYGGVMVQVGTRGQYTTISQMERERQRRDEFQKGCTWAAIALGLSFGPMLAIGMMLGW